MYRTDRPEASRSLAGYSVQRASRRGWILTPVAAGMPDALLYLLSHIIIRDFPGGQACARAHAYRPFEADLSESSLYSLLPPSEETLNDVRDSKLTGLK